MAKENSIKQPAKKERLAIKQKERVRRFYQIRARLPELTPEWWVGIGEVASLGLLLLVNFWLLQPFFGHEDTSNVFSAPVIPLLVSLTEGLVPFNYGVRIWLLIFLIFFPLVYYYFIREVAGRRLIAFLASFIAILPITVFLSARVELSILGEDGAHIASLTFVPLVCLLLLRFLRRGSFWAGIFSSLGTTLVALTSPLGSLVLLTFMGVITFSEMLLGQGRLKFLRFLFVFVLALGLAAFWYNPKFVIMTVGSTQGQIVQKMLGNLLPISFFALPLLGILGFLLFENRPQLQPMFIAFFLTVGFGLFSLGAGFTHPFPSRFFPAFGISLSFLIGVIFIWFFDFLRTSSKIKRLKVIFPYRRLIAFGMLVLIFGLIFLIIVLFSQDLWNLESAQVLGMSTEQKVGIWEIKESTNRVENIFGYAVTVLTVFSVLILKLII